MKEGFDRGVAGALLCLLILFFIFVKCLFDNYKMSRPQLLTLKKELFDTCV